MIVGPDLTWQTADSEALRQALEVDGVATGIPGPGLLDYVGDAAGTLWSWVTEWLGSRVSQGTLDVLYRSLMWVLGLTLLLVIALLIVRLWSLRSRPNRAGGTLRSALPAKASRRGPEGSWAEFDALLLADDVPGALEALWWWVARSVAPSGLDEAWTTDELLSATPQPSFDFARSMRQLDRMLYGGRLPESAEVLRLAQRITNHGPWRTGDGSP